MRGPGPDPRQVSAFQRAPAPHSVRATCCDNLPDLFDEVMALHNSDELDEFANSQAIVQPVAFQTCTTVAAPPATVRRVKHTRKATK